MAETEIPQDVRERVITVYVKHFEDVGTRIDQDPTEAELIDVACACVMADRASRAPDRDALASVQPEIKGLVSALCKLHERWLGDEQRDRNMHIYDDADLSTWAELVLDAAAKLDRLSRTALAPSVAEPTIMLSSNDPATGAPVHAPEAFLRTPVPHKGEPVAFIGPKQLEHLKRNPMSNALAWGASRSEESSIALYLASPPPVAEGMVLVPCEPTEAMIEAGSSEWWDTSPARRPGIETVGQRMALIYRAMIAATPNQADGAGE